MRDWALTETWLDIVVHVVLCDAPHRRWALCISCLSSGSSSSSGQATEWPRHVTDHWPLLTIAHSLTGWPLTVQPLWSLKHDRRSLLSNFVCRRHHGQLHDGANILAGVVCSGVRNAGRPASITRLQYYCCAHCHHVHIVVIIYCAYCTKNMGVLQLSTRKAILY